MSTLRASVSEYGETRGILRALLREIIGKILRLRGLESLDKVPLLEAVTEVDALLDEHPLELAD